VWRFVQIRARTKRPNDGPRPRLLRDSGPEPIADAGATPLEISPVDPSEFARWNDDLHVNATEPASSEQGSALLAMYDRAVPQVYGYLCMRTNSPVVAEDLTAETFLAAVQAIQRGSVPDLTVAWLIGVARHKLVDHWRRQAREESGLRLLKEDEIEEDDADLRFERTQARAVLASLGPHHRSALTLRYLDELSVPEVADHLGRTVHATEALLVRARNAFRAAYPEGRTDDV
jgi:RNA polymerase sigma-70 factor (ECF subfamily)